MTVSINIWRYVITLLPLPASRPYIQSVVNRRTSDIETPPFKVCDHLQGTAGLSAIGRLTTPEQPLTRMSSRLRSQYTGGSTRRTTTFVEG